MSFEHAPVSKGLMLSCALTSIVVGVFDVKHYVHLQLIPHISRHHQYWRLFVHHVAFESSSDLFIAELILYNVGVQIERQFGSSKFASFAIVSTLISAILEFVALLLLHRVGLNYIPAGPLALVFNILYQYLRIVPAVYQFRIFGVPVSNKIFTYILAAQLAIGRLPGSMTVALVGILVGQIYRSDLTNIKTYRIPPSVVELSTRFLLPLVGSTRPPRRLNRALPDESRGSAGSASTTPQAQNEEVITTAREPVPSAGAMRDRGNATSDGEVGSGASVVREWVNELTGRAELANAGVRVPSESEITQVTSMFPDVQRDVIIGALQRSANIEGAVEILLSSQE